VVREGEGGRRPQPELLYPLSLTHELHHVAHGRVAGALAGRLPGLGLGVECACSSVVGGWLVTHMQALSHHQTTSYLEELDEEVPVLLVQAAELTERVGDRQEEGKKVGRKGCGSLGSPLELTLTHGGPHPTSLTLTSSSSRTGPRGRPPRGSCRSHAPTNSSALLR
jgi:hypothetical protein